jgi:hypothetical protein
MKRLTARAPGLDLFGQGLVVRADVGWTITGKGRAFLAALERSASAEEVINDKPSSRSPSNFLCCPGRPQRRRANATAARDEA